MKKINNWLNKFMAAWKAYDIDNVMDLFAEDVEYWETPFDRLSDFSKLRSEWNGVKNQEDIEISCDVFSKDEDKYAVKWDLKYTDSNNLAKSFAGIYLIKLRSDNLCTYFFHCGEPKSASKKETSSSGGILANSKGQIALVLMDDKNWSFPKGHIEENETKLDAAKREVLEETGIGSLELIKELGTYHRPSADDENQIKNITLFLFRTSETKLNPISNDVTKAIWVDIPSVKSILSFQKDRDFFESVGDQLRDALS